MNPKILELNKKIQPYKDDVVNHYLYRRLNSIKDVAILMEHHIYAVWDFMSLLKTLQSILTCTSSPWKPIGDGKIRQLINSIVLEEESDIDQDGNPSSHYEMYLDAMQECGADTSNIKKFVANVTEKKIPKVSKGIDDFLKCTFDVIESKEAHKIAAAFTFGREDLIPDMFTSIVEEYNTDNNLNKFVYYLERHIELDGGEHGPLALQLICDLCGDDSKKWLEVEETAIACLIARKKLWDVILVKLN
ncbi:MAG: heme oxygenase [Flavobacteriales bacterium]|nr:heme oxygenase [Flavobacteriales bacterium]|tara:strand:- start:3513 stop:4253 length:741 start_codon:yes stop_codon:yes gene_type:complete